MIAILFEFTVKEGQDDAYFARASELRALVEEADGFLSIERFSSLAEEGKYISVSFWRDLEAVTAWRANLRHRAAQDDGKAEIFSSFRLRTAEVLREIRFEDGDREALDYAAE